MPGASSGTAATDEWVNCYDNRCIYAAVYVMFGVTLGFSLLLVWQEYGAARQTAEAAAAEEVYRLASRLPEPGRSRVQDAAVSYIRAVVEEEWSAMAGPAQCRSRGAG